MLQNVTATLDQSSAFVGLESRSRAGERSLADCDEFGRINGRLGLFTATVIPVALAGRDEQGRRLDRWAPDGDLL